jgi:hypothetical protein
MFAIGAAVVGDAEVLPGLNFALQVVIPNLESSQRVVEVLDTIYSFKT